MMNVGFQRNRAVSQPQVYEEMKSDEGEGTGYIYSIS
jgi:hypothetical protein